MARGKHFKKTKKSYKILSLILFIMIIISATYIINHFNDKKQVLKNINKIKKEIMNLMLLL